jgi:hypothetical protein
MEIHRQTCQKCGSRKLRNILVRADGSPDKVFVQCLGCKNLVARYIIAQQGYYHHGKGFESYLRGLNRGGYFESGKDIQTQFEEVKEICMEEYSEILKALKETEKDLDSDPE